MGTITSVTNVMGEVQGFMTQFSGGTRRDAQRPHFSDASGYYPPSGPPPPNPHPSSGVAHSSYAGHSAYPSVAHGFPSSPQQHSYPAAVSSEPSYPNEPSFSGGSSFPSGPEGHPGYAPSYSPAYTIPEPENPTPGFPDYGGDSYVPQPSFSGARPGYSHPHQSGGIGFPNANPPTGPGFPGSNFGFNDAPEDRPFNSSW